MESRICAITGCAGGIGFEILSQLASKTLDLSFVLINRTAEDNNAIRQKLPEAKIEASYAVDLAELDDLISVAERIKLKITKIDILILNAGVMMVPFGLTHVGVETHQQINFVSNKILVDILMPNLLNSDIGSRVIVTSSVAHTWSGEKFNYCKLKPKSNDYG